MRCLDTYIFEDPGMLEQNISDMQIRGQRTCKNRAYRQRLERSRSSIWIGNTPAEAMQTIEEFLRITQSVPAPAPASIPPRAVLSVR